MPQRPALRRAGVGLAAALLLTSCGGSETTSQNNQAQNDAQVAAAPAAPAPAQETAGRTPAKAAQPVLTSEGWGPLRIGMTRAEVVAALGEDRNPQAVGGPDPESCDQFAPARAPEGMLVMIEAGRLTRIDLTRTAPVATDRGLALGAPATAVRAAYGATLRAEPHKYEPAPAEYLTAWTEDAPRDAGSPRPPGARGVRYEVGADGKVRTIMPVGRASNMWRGVLSTEGRASAGVSPARRVVTNAKACCGCFKSLPVENPLCGVAPPDGRSTYVREELGDDDYRLG